MSIAATHFLDAIAIPRGMVWSDEFDWTPVAKSAEYSLTGALLIDAAVRQAGRPITLTAETDAGWIRRNVLQALVALSDLPDQAYVLTLADGRTYDVQFAPDKPIEAKPLARPELPPATYPYIATLRFITV